MCGIVGYVGKRGAKDFLLEGLKRLEYRGYDSAGMVLASEDKLYSVRSVGKVSELERKMEEKGGVLEKAPLGIAHTRWATHGKPLEKNAHPHMDCSGEIAIVHNGIIENYTALKESLLKKGHRFRSDTDSEVIAHLIEEYEKEDKSFEEAFSSALKDLKGTYGIVAFSLQERDKLLAARMGSPLVIGIGKGEFWIASDVSAILSHTKRAVYLEDGEWTIISKDGYRVKSGAKPKKKDETEIEWSESQAKKGGYPHFMLKEIFEQPESFLQAVGSRLLVEEGMAKLGGLREKEKELRNLKRLIIVSCGTSYHAGLVGEYMLEEYAGIPVEVEFASEFRYRKPLLDKHTAVLAISQSGETVDTLAALREAKRKGALTLGIVNVVGSAIARETDAGIYNHAGPEVSVASTKAFTSQVAVLALLTLYLGRQREMSLVTGQKIAKELMRIPKLMEKVLKESEKVKKIAKKYSNVDHYLYLGRKYNVPIALEGALKIKEIAYVAAQGYPTGEMKHGPIALVDPESLTVFLAPSDSVYEKSKSGLEQIRARGGRVVAIVTEKNSEIGKYADDVITIPKTLEMLTPLLSVIPLQLLAYHMSVAKGYDVDRPRNLAKSVTVE